MNTHPQTTTHPETATARVTLLMTPTEKKALFAKASEEGFGVSEYLRRKAFDHEPNLDALVNAVRESTKKALNAIDLAFASIDNRERNAGAREAEIRAKAAAEFDSWTPEQRSAVAHLFDAQKDGTP